MFQLVVRAAHPLFMYNVSHLLLDLGYQGPDYTWCKSSTDALPVWKRLDRGLSTMTWRFCFPEVYIRHLPRLHSDHSPLLLQLLTDMTHRHHLKPFHFQAMWFLHELFPSTVQKFWNTASLVLVQKLASFQEHLTHWNREIFGNVLEESTAL